MVRTCYHVWAYCTHSPRSDAHQNVRRVSGASRRCVGATCEQADAVAREQADAVAQVSGSGHEECRVARVDGPRNGQGAERASRVMRRAGQVDLKEAECAWSADAVPAMEWCIRVAAWIQQMRAHVVHADRALLRVGCG